MWEGDSREIRGCGIRLTGRSGSIRSSSRPLARKTSRHRGLQEEMELAPVSPERLDSKGRNQIENGKPTEDQMRCFMISIGSHLLTSLLRPWDS